MDIKEKNRSSDVDATTLFERRLILFAVGLTVLTLVVSVAL